MIRHPYAFMPIFLSVLCVFLAYACSTNSPSTTRGTRQSSAPPPARAQEQYPNASATDPDTVEPGQICVVNRNPTAAEKFEATVSGMGYTKYKHRHLKGLGFVMSIFHAPPGYTVKQGVLELREKFPELVIDANHRYRILASSMSELRTYGQSLVGWTMSSTKCGKNFRIGLVDTHVNRHHAALFGQNIETRTFLPDKVAAAPQGHGTAIAALLVGKPSDKTSGLLPQSKLIVAEIFRHSGSQHAETTTWLIARALDWLAGEDVDLVNLSFGGPQNALLSLAVSRTLKLGVVLVAAAGYLDAEGEPKYPAAQDGVLAVTALDANMHPHKRVSTGSHISFSAPGVDIWVPGNERSGKFVSGTSFAAPFVTAAIASLHIAHPTWVNHQVLQELEKTAKDLGTPGWDPIFGWGLVQAPFSCPQ